ncbi:MAG: LuxR family transcriptional regulator [Alphaproteobacteria bacterium]|nr:LuxR family transcriptional regulator [Alphaproteobacteria bacterium]MBU0795722.1 LuxR family transcriptional regulator [Alphaproteobacteria bacterium]MBU0887345.1 LuxR family transcriptional regulator [Alphaproteobacteria bacterium]MBU1811774.1 LuxR family transcriptional regulator [Alphaproteobacteria bacterium]
MNGSLAQKLVELHSLKTVAEFKSHLQDMAAAMGFGRIFYVGAKLVPDAHPGPGSFAETPLILCDYPSDWITHYQTNQLALIDPVIADCNISRKPQVWNVRDYLAQAASEPEQRLLRDAIDVGVDKGISIPIYGGSGDYGLVTFVWDGSAREMEALTAAMLQDCTLVANHFHLTLRNKIGTEFLMQEELKLTARELEVLKWVAAGKTQDEISEILTVSMHTVKFHIYNAHSKLNVFSTPHAIAKLVYLGILEPAGFTGNKTWRMV